MIDNRERVRVMMGAGGRQRSPIGLILRGINYEILAAFAILFGFFTWMLLQQNGSLVTIGTFGLVLVGWVFSLCLHEFSHAATAVLGGDTSDSTLRYLSFNPLRYVNIVFSIVMPIVILLLGGIALPGGAVYLRRDLVRGNVWQSLISLAGPLSNALCFVLLMLPFRIGLVNFDSPLGHALALLAFFQALAVILNLVPIPPLDGFGVLAPWLPRGFADAAYSVGMYAYLLFFLVLWYVPGVLSGIADTTYNAMIATSGVDLIPNAVYYGFQSFRFWVVR